MTIHDLLAPLGRAVLLLGSGTAIGWLAGIASTPQLTAILTALLTATVGAATLIAGIRKPEGDQPHATTKILVYPVAILSIGVAIGATIGVWAKTRDWLAPPPAVLVHQWTSVGLNPLVVAERLFERSEPDPTKVLPNVAPSVTRKGGLLAGDLEGCGYVLNEMNEKDLSALRSSLIEFRLSFAAVGQAVNDVETLRKVVTVLCRSSR